MDKEKLTWRTFGDRGAIQTRWNAGTPAYYILDAAGVIRHRWTGYPGEKALDASLHGLLQKEEAK